MYTKNKGQDSQKWSFGFNHTVEQHDSIGYRMTLTLKENYHLTG
jgi:hypothetical protein